MTPSDPDTTSAARPSTDRPNSTAASNPEAELEIFPIGIGSYRHHEALDVDAEVARICELLEEFGGYEVPWPTPMEERGGDAVDARLQAWGKPDLPANSMLYWVGHGWSDGTHFALAHARSPAAVRVSGVSPEKVAEPIRSRQETADGRWAIVVIDTCWSKQFVDKVSADLDVEGILLVGVAGDGPTTLGRFHAVLRACLHENFRTDQTIELWQLVKELDRRLPEGRVTGRRLGFMTLVRRATPVAASITVSLDVVNELEEALARLPEDERRHFLLKAQGVEEGEVSWFFEGRDAERAQIVDWLRAGSSGMLIVTGRAGSGKSALLGHILVHSKPELLSALTKSGLVDPLPPEELPPSDVFNEIIHLTGLTLDDLVQRVARATGLGEPPSIASPDAGTANDVDWLVDGLRSRSQPFTMLLDALDEATDPLAVARSLLHRLADVPGVRILVGTRASTTESPDHPAPDDQDLLDALSGSHEAPLDSDTIRIISIENDPDAITRYIFRRLTVARDRSTLAVDGRPVDDAAIRAVAEGIGQRGREFLFARLAIYELLAEPTLLEPARSRTLNRLLDGSHRDLFAAAVDRLTRRSDNFPPLLEALALARGRGVPIVDGIWALMATAIADGDSDRATITDVDVSALLDAAQPYIGIDVDAGQTVYRLAHRTYVEHFLSSGSSDAGG